MRATVIIPTHNHGALLVPAVRSVLGQTVADLELFIMGDGVTDETRAAVKTSLALDGRVRFYDHPKSPRTGEPYRHLALQEARGEIVCYLSDDDLWFPEHLETMERVLETNDVAHSLPFWVNADGSLSAPLIDWSLPEWRNWTLGGGTMVGVSLLGHTMDFYRRLPHGWRTTPAGRFTEHYMQEQLLTMPGMRASGTARRTVLGFPSTLRTDWTLERREEEMLVWEQKLATEPEVLIEGARRATALSYYHYFTGFQSADAERKARRAAQEEQRLKLEEIRQAAPSSSPTSRE